jgi:ribosomal protein S18 acetylase RimI-like enzyme
MEIRKATNADVENIADIYKACFPTELDHTLWIEASFNSYPKGVYYVASIKGHICGYILWCVKNGFREKTIIELEQIGIHPDFAGKGAAKKLIKNTVDKFKAHLCVLGHDVGAIIVTTSEGNFAERLYRSTLGVARAAVIADYGSGNEIIMYNNSLNLTPESGAN